MLKTIGSAALVLAGLSWFDASSAQAVGVLVTVEVAASTGAKEGDKVLVTVGDGSKGMPAVTGELKMITIRGRTFLGVQVTVSDPKYVITSADKAFASVLTGAAQGRKGTGAISAGPPYQSKINIP